MRKEEYSDKARVKMCNKKRLVEQEIKKLELNIG